MCRTMYPGGSCHHANHPLGFWPTKHKVVIAGAMPKVTKSEKLSNWSPILLVAFKSRAAVPSNLSINTQSTMSQAEST